LWQNDPTRPPTFCAAWLWSEFGLHGLLPQRRGLDSIAGFGAEKFGAFTCRVLAHHHFGAGAERFANQFWQCAVGFAVECPDWLADCVGAGALFVFWQAFFGRAD
jgi:hypothetical protein